MYSSGILNMSGVFSNAEACQGRAKAPDRATFHAQEDIMDDDAWKIEARITAEIQAWPVNGAAGGGKLSRSSQRSTLLEEQRDMLQDSVQAYRRLAQRKNANAKTNTNANTDAEHQVAAAIRTFRYLFYRHKRAVFVSVRGGRVRTYMGFINRRFQNPLASMLRLAPETPADVHRLLLEQHAVAVAAAATEGRSPPPPPDAPEFNPSALWGSIGCLLGGVRRMPAKPNTDGYEVDYNHAELRYFLDRVCDARKVRDCDFFLNYYDQVVLRSDLAVPFWHVVEPPAGRAVPTGAPRKAMCPVVSMCSRQGFLDMPCVFPDDIRRAWQVWVAPSCSNPYLDQGAYETVWSKKVPTAVFRGSATGCG